jgi:1,4-alpha-glucan branching enzyme
LRVLHLCGHPLCSFVDYRIGLPCAGDWVVALDSDHTWFGGQGRIDPSTIFAAQALPHEGRPFSTQVYSPCRTVFVLKLAGSGEGPGVLPIIAEGE